MWFRRSSSPLSRLRSPTNQGLRFNSFFGLGDAQLSKLHAEERVVQCDPFPKQMRVPILRVSDLSSL
jgi:hypothetical protein